MARFVRIVALFTLLTAIMTWPQAARLGRSFRFLPGRLKFHTLGYTATSCVPTDHPPAPAQK